MALTLTDVRLTYPDGDHRLVAVDGVNLRITAGELVVVTGPPGSGNYSLLAVADALTSPGSGTVRIDDTNVTALDQEGRDRLRRERTGFVFQQRVGEVIGMGGVGAFA